MDKRQLVRALNATFLGALKSNLIERLHEFTDCAYTKHEHRQTLLALLGCIKFQLHRFVKLIYRLVSGVFLSALLFLSTCANLADLCSLSSPFGSSSSSSS